LSDFLAQFDTPKMGKRSRKEDATVSEKSNGTSHAQTSILVDDKAVDPTLALLFASSVSIPKSAH
jgi:nucleolar protein 12